MTQKRNLVLPGNPRYQPSSMVPHFGYDNLSRWWIELELALLKALTNIGYLPPDAQSAFCQRGAASRQIDLESCITTTRVDYWEKTAKRRTKHDIRALILLMKKELPPALGRWVHFSGTSFDIRDSASILAYRWAYGSVTRPTIRKVGIMLADKAEGFADTVQIGRTHGQHALPITVGFWLATILQRLMEVASYLDVDVERLRGKFSGAVGAYNAQVGLGIQAKYEEWRAVGHTDQPTTFEAYVLSLVGLKPALISTQILPPEPLCRFLHSHVQLSAVIAQLARDCRHLQRSEIAEVSEGFEKGQTGSSTMAHKRNPITFENLEGIFHIVKAEYPKVLDGLISEHQRDLVGSSIMREYPGIVVLVQYQLETLNRALKNLTVDPEALKRNFQQSSHLILSEPLYLALILGGFPRDAHHFINHTLVPRSQASGNLLVVELLQMARRSKPLQEVIEKIPPDILKLLHEPKNYVGRAREKALEIAAQARRVFAPD